VQRGQVERLAHPVDQREVEDWQTGNEAEADEKRGSVLPVFGSTEPLQQHDGEGSQSKDAYDDHVRHLSVKLDANWKKTNKHTWQKCHKHSIYESLSKHTKTKQNNELSKKYPIQSP
jgi:hypothetical protein